MSDDLKNTGLRDRERISIKQVWERRAWAKAMGISETTLRLAVKTVGPMVADVKAWLIARITAA